MGYDKEPELVNLCDASGHVWVHERCAAWTLSSIATKSSTELTVDLTNQILSKVSYKWTLNVHFCLICRLLSLGRLLLTALE